MNPQNILARILLTLLVLSCACGPGSESVSKLSAGFQKSRDFESLSHIVGHLRLGMPRAEVEKILGEPDFSPIDGLYYYSASDRKTEEGTPIGLIVEYRRTNQRTGEVLATGKLESFFLGPIGE